MLYVVVAGRDLICSPLTKERESDNPTVESAYASEMNSVRHKELVDERGEPIQNMKFPNRNQSEGTDVVKTRNQNERSQT